MILRLILSILLALPFLLSAQGLEYDKSKLVGMTPVKVNMMEAAGGFNAELTQIAAPPPSGTSYRDELARQKAKSAALYPRRTSQNIQNRSVLEQPTIERSLKGNNGTGGRPLDNNFAVNNEGQLVMLVNSSIEVKSPQGILSLGMTLEDFADALPTNAFMFDPKINFDPIADRYIMTWLGGNNPNTSIIVFAFSETNDATGDWNLYGFTGNPNDNGTWSDYPMITYTNDECFLTLNSILDGVAWQVGFTKTIIYQINKAQGFAGEELDITLWQDVFYDGKPVRNVCPIKPATEVAGDEVFFLSNRNFDITNDSIFFIHINGKQDVAELSVDVLKSNLNYGVPPDGEQEVGFLATNDGRILDGYLLGDRIEFVGNSINHNNGRASVFHGTIRDVFTAPSLTANIISDDNQDYGYPSIAYTGLEPTDLDGIIMFSHTAVDRPAGHSAVYFNSLDEYSDPLTLKEGNSYIDMIDNSDIERWGDYSANQRDFINPGMVWTASSFGNTVNRNATWLSQLARPGVSVSTRDVLSPVEIAAFPNPTNNDLKITFEINDVDNLLLQVVDLSGRIVKVIHNDTPKRQGKLEFTMSTAPLTQGIYFLQIIADGQSIGNEKIVVQ